MIFATGQRSIGADPGILGLPALQIVPAIKFRGFRVILPGIRDSFIDLAETP